MSNFRAELARGVLLSQLDKLCWGWLRYRTSLCAVLQLRRPEAVALDERIDCYLLSASVYALTYERMHAGKDTAQSASALFDRAERYANRLQTSEAPDALAAIRLRSELNMCFDEHLAMILYYMATSLASAGLAWRAERASTEPLPVRRWLDSSPQLIAEIEALCLDLIRTETGDDRTAPPHQSLAGPGAAGAGSTEEVERPNAADDRLQQIAYKVSSDKEVWEHLLPTGDLEMRAWKWLSTSPAAQDLFERCLAAPIMNDPIAHPYCIARWLLLPLVRAWAWCARQGTGSPTVAQLVDRARPHAALFIVEQQGFIVTDRLKVVLERHTALEAELGDTEQTRLVLHLAIGLADATLFCQREAASGEEAAGPPVAEWIELARDIHNRWGGSEEAD